MLLLMHCWASASELTNGCLVLFILTAKLVLKLISGSYWGMAVPMLQTYLCAVAGESSAVLC